MNVPKRLLALLFVGALSVSAGASAAVTCVMNKATGKYEPKKGTYPSKQAMPDCEAQSPAVLLAALADDSTEPRGTRLIDGVVLTNAAKLPEGPKPVQAKRPKAENGRVTAGSMQAGVAPTKQAVEVALATETAPVPVVEQKPIVPVWVVTPSARLKLVVREWAARAGWTVEWHIRDAQTQDEQDFVLGGGMRVEGDFPTAVHALFNSLPEKIKVRAKLAPDNFPPLLYVYREGETQ
jgi:hypothetical protein